MYMYMYMYEKRVGGVVMLQASRWNRVSKILNWEVVVCVMRHLSIPYSQLLVVIHYSRFHCLLVHMWMIHCIMYMYDHDTWHMYMHMHVHVHIHVELYRAPSSWKCRVQWLHSAPLCCWRPKVDCLVVDRNASDSVVDHCGTHASHYTHTLYMHT